MAPKFWTKGYIWRENFLHVVIGLKPACKGFALSQKIGWTLIGLSTILAVQKRVEVRRHLKGIRQLKDVCSIKIINYNTAIQANDENIFVLKMSIFVSACKKSVVSLCFRSWIGICSIW